jgi:hypothetical protein
MFADKLKYFFEETRERFISPCGEIYTQILYAKVSILKHYMRVEVLPFTLMACPDEKRNVFLAQKGLFPTNRSVCFQIRMAHFACFQIYQSLTIIDE